MVRVFRKVMLISAFLIAIFIFLAGTYVGFLLDDYRVKDVDSALSYTELDTESFVTERDFFETFVVRDCELLNERMDLLGEDLGEIGRILNRYNNKRISEGDEFNYFKRKYFLLEIRAYTLRKEMLDSCDSTSNVVLFFYNTENNQESLNQGYALDALVEKSENVVVFSFDVDFDESALHSLMEYYNVTTAPTIVIDFDKKLEGFIPEGVIRSHLIR